MISLKVGYNKNKLYRTLDYWSRDMLNFNFPEKGLGLVILPHFVYDFSKKVFLMLYSINWPKFFVCFSYFSRHQLVLLLFFLINSFCYMTKKSRQKFRYLENKKNFWSEMKSRFERAFNCQNLYQTGECVLKLNGYWEKIILGAQVLKNSWCCTTTDKIFKKSSNFNVK